MAIRGCDEPQCHTYGLATLPSTTPGLFFDDFVPLRCLRSFLHGMDSGLGLPFRFDQPLCSYLTLVLLLCASVV